MIQDIICQVWLRWLCDMYIDFKIHFQLLQMPRSIFENISWSSYLFPKCNISYKIINGTYPENTGVHFANINNILLIQRLIFALLGFREHI